MLPFIKYKPCGLYLCFICNHNNLSQEMILITAAMPYNIKSFIRDIVLFIIIVLVVYFFLSLWQQRSFSSYSWYVPAFLFFLNVYKLVDKRRVLNIKFDNASHQIIIQYKTLFSKPGEERIPFETARLEIVSRRWKPLPSAIYFLRGKTEVYGIKRNEDLSQDQLIVIVDAASRLNIQVEKV